MDDSVVVSGVSQFVSRLQSEPKIFAVGKIGSDESLDNGMRSGLACRFKLLQLA